MTAIDETDQRILTMLEADGRATLAQLAQATGLSVSAAQSRVQKLEKRGIIKGYKAIIDQEQRGLPISAFVNVTPLDYFSRILDSGQAEQYRRHRLLLFGGRRPQLRTGGTRGLPHRP